MGTVVSEQPMTTVLGGGSAGARPGSTRPEKSWRGVWLVDIRWALMPLAFLFTSLAKVFTGACRDVHLPSSLSGTKASSTVKCVRRLINVLPI
jgi:hypothetical protein